MDYKRIQIILIITFSILNLYLITVLLEKDKELNAGDPSTTVRLEEGMRNDNIEAPELSDEQIRIPILKADKTDYLAEHAGTLSNQTTRMENNKLWSVLTNPIELDMSPSVPLEERLAPIEAFMKDGNVLKAQDYSFLTYQEANQRIIYVQHAEEYPIADGTASLTFHLNPDGEVVSYEQTYIGLPEAQGKNRMVISEQAAIEALYLNNQIPNNSSLRRINLTYYQTLSLQDMNIYSPMWYVEIARDDVPIQVKYVDALTGNLISVPSIMNPNSSSKPEEDSVESSIEDAVLQTNEALDANLNVDSHSDRILIAE